MSLPQLYNFWNKLSFLGLKDSYVVGENDFLLMTLFDLMKKTLKLNSLDFQKFISKNLYTQSAKYIWEKQSIYKNLKEIWDEMKTAPREDFIEAVLKAKKHQNLRLNILNYIENYKARFAQELNLSKVNFNPKTVPDFLKIFFTEKDTFTGLVISKSQNKKSKWYLKIFSYLVQTREENRLLRAKFFDILRELYSAVGIQLFKLGYLQSSEQIHYLTFDEIWDFVNLNSVNSDLKKLVHIRELDYTKVESQELFGVTKFPDFYRQKLVHDKLPQTGNGDVKKLFGQTVSSGIVTGKITVLKEFPTKLEKSYGIIVAPNTDPGWIEIFPRIQGLIIENGGLLSHASIVCRELEIPCISGVQDACRKLTQGQQATLNADQGFVQI